MNPSHFSLDIKDPTGFYEVSLHEVSKSSKNTVSISGKNYRILGSESAISKLSSNINGLSFENVNEFVASINHNVRSQEKTKIVFKEIVGKDSDSMGKAEKQFWKWLSCFNSGEENQIREFKHQFKNPEKYSVAGNLDFFELVQGFNFVKILESSPSKVVVLLQEQCRFQEYGVMTLEVEAEGKHPLILKMVVDSPDDKQDRQIQQMQVEVQRMPENEALKAIDVEINRLEKEGKFSGTVLVTKVENPIPLISRTVGKSNFETESVNTLQTKFNLASMGKMFTAVVIHQLAEEEKIDLKKPIGTYLKTDIHPSLAEVTIEQLLTHTGGAGGLTGDEINEEMGPKDFMRLLKDREREFDPGTEWKYSNYGFVLLGAVIEEVCQKSYYDCIQERVFEKAEMKNSDFHLKTDESSNTATGYIRKRRGLESNIDALPLRGSPAGGGYSTAEDLNRFANALLENKLLNADSVNAISTPKRVTHKETIGLRSSTSEAETESLDVAEIETKPLNDFKPIPHKDYPAFTSTLGFQDGDLWFGHAGRSEGVNSELRIYPKAGYVVTVMGNLDPPAASNLAKFIGARLPG